MKSIDQLIATDPSISTEFKRVMNADPVAAGLIREANADFRRDIRRFRDACGYSEIADYEFELDGCKWPATVEYDYTYPERRTRDTPAEQSKVDINVVKVDGVDITRLLPKAVIEAMQTYFGDGRQE